MSISNSMNNAISGMAAASRMAEVVSSNISNALTEGYGRREVQLSSKDIGGVGAGVHVAGITRHVNKAIIADRRIAEAEVSGYQRQASSLARVEQVVGAVDDPAGIMAKLTGFEVSLISALEDPSSDQRLGAAVIRIKDVAESLNSATETIQQLRSSADTDIANDVSRLNNALENVYRLNGSIGRALGQGGDASALLDQRQMVIDTISEIVPIREMDRANGAIALLTTSGHTLIDGQPREISFERTPTIVADSTFSSGALGGILIDGEPHSVTDGVGKFTGGSLEASFLLRDRQLVSAQTGLDSIAADLITRFEKPTVDATLGATDPGLLTDGGGRFDASNIVGLAGRVSVNALVDPTMGGQAARMRDGVLGVGAVPIGDGQQISRWLNALTESHSFDVAIPATSASANIAFFTSEIVSERLGAEETLTFSTSRFSMLYEAELAEGVDTDVELQNLLQIEQAYSANARLIQTASSMIQTLMEI